MECWFWCVSLACYCAVLNANLDYVLVTMKMLKKCPSLAVMHNSWNMFYGAYLEGTGIDVTNTEIAVVTDLIPS